MCRRAQVPEEPRAGALTALEKGKERHKKVWPIPQTRHKRAQKC